MVGASVWSRHRGGGVCSALAVLLCLTRALHLLARSLSLLAFAPKAEDSQSAYSLPIFLILPLTSEPLLCHLVVPSVFKVPFLLGLSEEGVFCHA